jgi:hypothetical protein
MRSAWPFQPAATHFRRCWAGGQSVVRSAFMAGGGRRLLSLKLQYSKIKPSKISNASGSVFVYNTEG